VKVALGLVAALLVGVGLVLQQAAAEQAPKSYFLQLRLIADLLHRRRWLAGISFMIGGWVLSAWTIGNLDLSVAEPLLATNLLWALLVAIPLTGMRPRISEILGAVLLSGGVAALSVSRTISAPTAEFGSVGYWPAAAGIAAIAFILVRAGWRRTGQTRALLTGTATGLLFGISDALTRGTLLILNSHGIGAALTSWPAYSLAGASLLALWLMESAFNAAPLNASLPAITAAEPVIGILLGVVVFGDDIRISPGTLALQAAGLAALVGGVILVARAPMLSGLRPVQVISHALSADHPHADHPEAEHAGPAETAHDSPSGQPAARKPEREEV
jgi:drug/metabolite transporter (DMT)-like permease